MSTFEIISVIGAIIAFFGGGLSTVLWFLVRGMIGSLRDMEDDLNAHKLFSANVYAKDSDFKSVLRDIQQTMSVMQNALNTNTNMTSVISEKISTLTDRLNHRS